MGKEKRTDYRAGFASALKVTYGDRHPYMETTSEKILGEQPPRLDALVLKCDPMPRLTDEIGSFFEEHNVLEFKGYGDGISINDYYKAQAYALMYMVIDRKVNEIPPSSVTLTIMQHRYPQAAFDLLQKRGCEIVERSHGIWEVSGQSPFRCQVVNVQELPETWYLFKLIVPGLPSSISRKRRMITSMPRRGRRETISGTCYVPVPRSTQSYSKRQGRRRS